MHWHFPDKHKIDAAGTLNKHKTPVSFIIIKTQKHTFSSFISLPLSLCRWSLILRAFPPSPPPWVEVMGITPGWLSQWNYPDFLLYLEPWGRQLLLWESPTPRFSSQGNINTCRLKTCWSLPGRWSIWAEHGRPCGVSHCSLWVRAKQRRKSLWSECQKPDGLLRFSA